MEDNHSHKKDLFEIRRFVIKLDTVPNDSTYRTFSTHWIIKDLLYGRKWHYNSLQHLFNDKARLMEDINVPRNQTQFFYLDIPVDSVDEVKNIFLSFL